MHLQEPDTCIPSNKTGSTQVNRGTLLEETVLARVACSSISMNRLPGPRLYHSETHHAEEDHARARPAQRLVRGGRHHIAVLKRLRQLLRRHQAAARWQGPPSASQGCTPHVSPVSGASWTDTAVVTVLAARDDGSSADAGLRLQGCVSGRQLLSLHHSRALQQGACSWP